MGTKTFGLLAILLIVTGGGAKIEAMPAFSELQYNSKWYRTFDSSSNIVPASGQLLFNWKFEDPSRNADSFFVGIDTLWSLPQDVDGDTLADWDLQVCPDEICMDGLKRGVHGANAPYPFGAGNFETEHHFQFFPAINEKYNYTSPKKSIFGAMMFCRSRSSGISDTVLGFGSWNLKWDTLNLPPVRPIAGYLPRLSDFIISGDTVRYIQAGAEVNPIASKFITRHELRVASSSGGTLALYFPEIHSKKQISVFKLDGTLIWKSEAIPEAISKISLNPYALSTAGVPLGMIIVRLSWADGRAWGKATLLPY
jgi:hypothetical protein